MERGGSAGYIMDAALGEYVNLREGIHRRRLGSATAGGISFGVAKIARKDEVGRLSSFMRPMRADDDTGVTRWQRNAERGARAWCGDATTRW